MVFSETPVTYINGPKSEFILWSTNSVMGPKIEAIRDTKAQKRGNRGKHADKYVVINCLFLCVYSKFILGRLLMKGFTILMFSDLLKIG